MAEKSFRAGKGRDGGAKQFSQSFRFGEVVIARAGPVGVDVVDGRRIKPGAAQGRLHRGESARAFGMRRGDVVRIATRAPAAQAC